MGAKNGGLLDLLIRLTVIIIIIIIIIKMPDGTTLLPCIRGQSMKHSVVYMCPKL